MRWLFAVCLLTACAGSPQTAAPAPRVEVRGDSWSIAYRLVLDDPAAPRLEGRAEVRNTTAEDWIDAKLTLATASTGIDRDGDGLRDSADLCPGDREDVDGHNDDDGCPEPDNDSDRILDEIDKCPDEAETYNHHGDDDGCPDRLPVRIHGPGGFIDWVFFAAGSDVVKPVSFPIIDAIAATIMAHPHLRVIEISGHTDRTERDPWGLSLRRAAAVSQRLIDKGVAPDRLTLGPYAAMQPSAGGASAADLARNRRAGFVIVERDDDVATGRKVVVAPAVRPPYDPPPPELADDLRYELAQPVTVQRGQAATLAIIDKPITARELLLWQPDPEVVGSRSVAFRAVRLVNTSGFVLQRGPIEIVAGGRMVGRAVLRRLGIGETAWIRGQLERATLVHARGMVIEEPLRVVGGDRGSLVVENVATQRMLYTIETESSQRLEIHHRRLPQHSVKELPSAAVELADRLVVTRELTAGVKTRVLVDEQQPHRLNRQIDSIGATELRIYLEGSNLPPHVVDPLRAVLTRLRAIETHQQALAAERVKLGEIALRWQQTRRPLDRAMRVELDEIARSIGQATELLARDRALLDELIAKLPAW